MANEEVSGAAAPYKSSLSSLAARWRLRSQHASRRLPRNPETGLPVLLTTTRAYMEEHWDSDYYQFLIQWFVDTNCYEDMPTRIPISALPLDRLRPGSPGHDMSKYVVHYTDRDWSVVRSFVYGLSSTSTQFPPLLVTRVSSRARYFYLGDGYHRFAAARLLGWTDYPAIVVGGNLRIL